MIRRNITNKIETLALDLHKMAFISGPRQCGKTTLAKSLLAEPNLYFNWDQIDFKKRWTKNPNFIADIALSSQYPRVVLDEIHKNQKWKNQLKGLYDQYGRNIDFIVTGSANLNVYRKGADSLLGRFIHFHTLPLTLGELENPETLDFKNFLKFIDSPRVDTSNVKTIHELMRFGGFPEPFLKQREDFHNIWQKNRIELLIRQDLRELSNILHIHQVEILASFLPERVGCPLSVQSLVEDLDGSYNSVKNWLENLKSVYYHFEIKPYSKGIARSIKKEGKYYLYDWTQVESEGARFENLVALHLMKLVTYYNDTGQANLDLFYLKNKSKQEVDFLVTQKNSPLFSVEVKLNELNLDKTFQVFQKKEKFPHFQVCLKNKIFREFKQEGANFAYVISASDFLKILP